MRSPGLVRHQCPVCGEAHEAVPAADVGHDCPLRLTSRGRRRWVWFVVVAREDVGT